jgi:hypothetical protein
MHPHIARLNPANLEVRYRASEAPQILTVNVLGVPKATWKPDYAIRLWRIVESVKKGCFGGSLFPPENGRAEIVEGPIPPDEGMGPEFTWKVRVQSLNPEWLVLLLDEIADGWSATDNLTMGERFEPSPEYYPKRISVIGELPPDDSGQAVHTNDVLDWLRDPSAVYRPWPEMPFTLKESTATKGARLRIKTASATAAVEQELDERLLDIGPILDAHPRGGWPNLSPQVAATKTQLTVKWDEADLPCPGSIARGPILNLLRTFHFQVAALTQVELILPEG